MFLTVNELVKTCSERVYCGEPVNEFFQQLSELFERYFPRLFNPFSNITELDKSKAVQVYKILYAEMEATTDKIRPIGFYLLFSFLKVGLYYLGVRFNQLSLVNLLTKLEDVDLHFLPIFHTSLDQHPSFEECINFS